MTSIVYFLELYSSKRGELRPKPLDVVPDTSFRPTKIAFNPEPVPIKGLCQDYTWPQKMYFLKKTKHQ